MNALDVRYSQFFRNKLLRAILVWGMNLDENRLMKRSFLKLDIFSVDGQKIDVEVLSHFEGMIE